MKISLLEGSPMMVPGSESIVKATPAVGLALALIALIFWPVPQANLDLLKEIAAGFLGALTQARMTGGSTQ